MNMIKRLQLYREAKKLREQLSKLGYSRKAILTILDLYGCPLEDMR